MNLKEAKEQMKSARSMIKYYKEKRMEISAKITEEERIISNLKGAIFRGEII